MAGGTHIRFTNWEGYQHYQKKRNKGDAPPKWIKLHLTLLDSDSFNDLPESTQNQITKLMLLAARKGNSIRADAAYIRQNIHAKSKVDIDLIVNSGICEYYTPASNLLADCAQPATLEEEEEKEEEKEEEEERSSPSGSTPKPDTDLSEISKVVNACRYAFPNGMYGAGPSQHQKVRDLIALAGGTDQAKAMLDQSAEKRAPLDYALAIAKRQAAEEDRKNDSKPKAKEGITWNPI